MQKNDIIELKIEDMGVDGEGIGKYDGMTFFVKDAVLGDEIEARITKMKKNYGYARVEQILSPSKFRVTPQCELHRRCGGCQIQALDYEKQLEFKQNKVCGNLIRIGGFAPELIDRIMLPVVGMKEPYRYRNKAQFPIGADKDGNPVAGFYAARTHSIIPVNDCKLGVEENQIIYTANNDSRPEVLTHNVCREIIINTTVISQNAINLYRFENKRKTHGSAYRISQISSTHNQRFLVIYIGGNTPERHKQAVKIAAACSRSPCK